MRKLLILVLLITLIPFSAKAMEFEAPEVPQSGESYMPAQTSSFLEDLLFILRKAMDAILPEISAAAGTCLCIVAVMMLCSIIQLFPGASRGVIHLASTILIGVILIHPASTLIRLGAKTVTEMTEYSKLLLPVLTGALAAQGGVTASAALYAGTAFFSAVLSTLVTKLILPILYVYMCLVLIHGATGEDMLKNLCDLCKWLVCWGLKIVLYIFIGFMGITGVISGTADASAVKAAKLAITGMVPVVGGIISEASETILVSAGMMKNAAGVYGVLAILAVFIGPFLKIGAQYLLLKMTGSVCAVFGIKNQCELLKNFSSGMGMVLAMTGTVCLLLLIAVVCFMKGMS